MHALSFLCVINMLMSDDELLFFCTVSLTLTRRIFREKNIPLLNYLTGQSCFVADNQSAVSKHRSEIVYITALCSKVSAVKETNWKRVIWISTVKIRLIGVFYKQEAQLSPRDRAMRRVNWNLANCHATVQKLLIREALTESMIWSWRLSRRQCVIDNVHSTMTRPCRLPLSQVS